MLAFAGRSTWTCCSGRTGVTNKLQTSCQIEYAEQCPVSRPELRNKSANLIYLSIPDNNQQQSLINFRKPYYFSTLRLQTASQFWKEEDAGCFYSLVCTLCPIGRRTSSTSLLIHPTDLLKFQKRFMVAYRLNGSIKFHTKTFKTLIQVIKRNNRQVI